MVVKLPQEYVEDFPIESLHPHPDNPRSGHDDDWLDESIEGTGFSGAIEVQKSTGRIISGHGRIASLRRSGETTAPVFLLDVDDLLAKKMVLSRNPPPGSPIEYDPDLLAKLLGEMAEMGELYGTGYDPDMLDDLLAASEVIVLAPQEFEGGYVETEEELAKRAERVAVTQASQGMREMVFVFKQDDYDAVQKALAVIADFHNTATNSGTVVAALVNYAKEIESEA